MLASPNGRLVVAVLPTVCPNDQVEFRRVIGPYRSARPES